MKKRKLLSTYVLILMLFFTIVMTFAIFKNFERTNTTEVGAALTHYKNELDNTFEDVYFSTAMAETIIQLDYERFTQDDLAFMLEPIASQDGVRNVSILPDGIVEYVYPVEGNEQAIGDNIFEMPDRQQEAQLAIETRETILCGPHELTQGGVGLISRKAIFVDNAEGVEELWGFIAIVMDMDAILAELDLDSMNRSGFEYELVAEIAYKDSILVEKSDNFNSENATFTELELPNGKWTIGIFKVFTSSQLISIFVTLLFGVALSLLIYNLMLKKETAAFESNKEKYVDQLTKLYNRKKLDSFAEKLEKRPIDYTVIFIDINDFKPINDNYGHDVGDIYLIEIAQRLKSVTRPFDTVIRLGGDEFVIILIDVADPKVVNEVISRLDAVQRENFETETYSLPIDLSYGYVVNDVEQGMPFEEVLRLADQLMYEDKRQKKNNNE